MTINYTITSVDSRGEMEVIIEGVLYRYFLSYEEATEIYLDFMKARNPGQRTKVFKRIRSLKKYERAGPVTLTSKK